MSIKLYHGDIGSISIFRYWEIFNFIRYFNIEDCTILLKKNNNFNTKERMDMIKNIFIAYDYFFYHNIKFPKIEIITSTFPEDDFYKRWCSLTYQYWNLDKSIYWPHKFSPIPKKYITVSLVKSRLKFKDDLKREIKSEYVDILLEAFSSNKNIIDLGDSRKFETSEKLIEKINYIRASKFYIGSLVSWKDIARLFGIYILDVRGGYAWRI